jgi:hypothetical protein
MHNVKLIRRRFPNQSNRIIGVSLLLSVSALVLGAGLLFLQ